MSSLNKVILIGRLGKKPKERVSTNNTSISNYSIATSEIYKKKDGSKETITEWHNIFAFGKLAEICNKYLDKGTLIYLEGKISTSKYNKEGEEKEYKSIIANKISILDNKKDINSNNEPSHNENFLDDNIPF